MSECRRNECGECLGDYEYFVNQQPAVFNTAQSSSLDCPQGYTCDPVDPSTEDAGTTKIIPDLPPYSPNQDPNCDSLCEVNRVIIGKLDREQLNGLRPKALVKNSEITISCSDVDEASSGGQTYTYAADQITYAYTPGATSSAAAQAYVDGIAKAKAMEEAQARFESGALQCGEWAIYINLPRYNNGNEYSEAEGGDGWSTYQHVAYGTPIYCSSAPWEPLVFCGYQYNNQISPSKTYGPYSNDVVLRVYGHADGYGAGDMTAPYQWYRKTHVTFFPAGSSQSDVASKYNRVSGAEIWEDPKDIAGGSQTTNEDYELFYILPAGQSVLVGCWYESFFQSQSTHWYRLSCNVEVIPS